MSLPPPPAVTAVRLTGGAGRARLPLLVLGPSLGTSATALWSRCAGDLTDAFDVLAWDLPGHGHNRAVPPAEPPDGGPLTMAELARGVLAVVDDVLTTRGDPGGSFAYAGVSVGGAVGLQLLLDAPDRVGAAVLLCTGARIGDDDTWSERLGRVTASGTASLVEGSAQRWFAPGFVEREPAAASTLLHALREAADDGYAQVCRALAAFDVRDRLGSIAAPVLAVAGGHDEVTPPASLREVADGVRDGRLEVLDDAAHLAPAEQPAVVARLVRAHVLGETETDTETDTEGGGADGAAGVDDRYAAGLEVRRAVLGEAHVDRASAAVTDLTRDFQRFITEYAWGGVWTRPGLDRRSRSLVTLTALVAGGHHDELALHLRAARTNGLSDAEIAECLLQSAVYCGVPAANTAFKIAQEVLGEADPAE